MAKAKKTAALTLEERLKQALVPEEEQPYPVPGNWCWTRLGEVIHVFSGKGLTSKNMVGDGGIPVYGGNGINGYHNESNVESETIVLGRVGFYCGCVHFICESAWVTDNALIVEFNSEKIHTRFLFWLLSCIDLRKNDGSTAQPVISGSKIYSIEIPFPPLAEQQRIIDRIESLFAKLDEAKEKTQAALDGFETRKAAILHKAFTGELTAKWRKENGVGTLSWEKFELRQVCTINPKKMDTKNLPDALEVSFFPMVSLSEIYGAITDPQTRKLKDVRTGFTNFFEGDIVFAKITPCMENGKSAIIGKLINNIGYGTTEFYVLRCGKEIYNRYLYHIVRNRTFRDEAQAVMSGAVGQQRVPKEFMETYTLDLPSIPEQTEIVRILDDFFSKEQKAKELCSVLGNIDLIKKSILARAFRGELGTNDPAEESAVELLKTIL